MRKVEQTTIDSQVDTFGGRKSLILLAPYLGIMLLAVIIGTLNLSDSGTLWPDGPRYANAAAMIHDWLTKGSLLHPYEFAKQNYCQYPAFNIPYHPPAYPGLLGMFFVVTGVSFGSSRLFIALCLGLAGCLFFMILRKFNVSQIASFVCSVLFITTPEIVHWARDTMSEIPALLFILCGSYFFLSWLQSKHRRDCWLAFGFAELAFLSRVTTIGILPIWPLVALLTGKGRQLFSPHFILAGLLYLVVNVSWVMFVTDFSRFEIVDNNAKTRVERLEWDNFAYYPSHVLDMVGPGLLFASLVGLCYVIFLSWKERRCVSGVFWICWLLGYYIFQLILATNEQRYFLFALPAFAGLVSCLFSPLGKPYVRRVVGPGLVILCVITNIMGMTTLPHGLVGYDVVAKRLVELEKPGNVLLATRDEQDLIFRYRALDPDSARSFIRSDRTLAIRLAGYAGIAPRALAKNLDDVVKVIKEYRTRYFVTYSPFPPGEDKPGVWYPQDLKLAHEISMGAPYLFELIQRFPLRIDYNKTGQRAEIFLWEYLGDFSDTPSTRKTNIPTAGLELNCTYGI